MLNKIKQLGRDKFVRASGILFTATTIFNILNYLFQLLMGRMLGPADYGIFATLFSIVYLVSAPLSAIQTAITNFFARFKAEKAFGKIKNLFIRASKKIFLVSAVLTGVFLIFSRQIADFLNITSTIPIIVFGFFFLVTFVLSVSRGALQGLQKFKALGANIILESSLKLILSVTLVLAGFGLLGALWSVNIALFIVFFITIFSLRKIFSYESERVDRKEIYAKSLPILVAIIMLTAVYTLDVILVKHFFNPIAAGHYAAASLLAKIIFFASSSVSLVMFPKVAELHALKNNASDLLKKTLAFVAFLSIAGVTFYFLFSNFVVNFVFGAEYMSITPLIGLFGLAMGLFSIAFVLVNYYLALGRTKFIYVLLPICALEFVLIWIFHNSLEQVIWTVLGTVVLILAGLLAMYKAK